MAWEHRPRVITVSGKWFWHNGQQVTGTSDPGAITVAVENDRTLPSETSLHHELFHKKLERNGVNDRGHSLREWQPGGLVEVTRVAMKERGM